LVQKSNHLGTHLLEKKKIKKKKILACNFQVKVQNPKNIEKSVKQDTKDRPVMRVPFTMVLVSGAFMTINRVGSTIDASS
jgi:hypothetical protein